MLRDDYEAYWNRQADRQTDRQTDGRTDGKGHVLSQAEALTKKFNLGENGHTEQTLSPKMFT